MRTSIKLENKCKCAFNYLQSFSDRSPLRVRVAGSRCHYEPAWKLKGVTLPENSAPWCWAVAGRKKWGFSTTSLNYVEVLLKGTKGKVLLGLTPQRTFLSVHFVTSVYLFGLVSLFGTLRFDFFSFKQMLQRSVLFVLMLPSQPQR